MNITDVQSLQANENLSNRGVQLGQVGVLKDLHDDLDAAVLAAIQPWPATLPEQVRAVAQLLASSATALPVAAIESGFKGKGKGRWKKSLSRILGTLEALGRARREGALWRA